MTSLRALARIRRGTRTPQTAGRPAQSDAATEDRVRLTRRRALLTGGLLGAGAGVTGILAGAPLLDRTEPFAIPPLVSGKPLLRGTVVNVRDLGAIGDGRTDDSTAVRRGLAEANAARGTLFFPAGTYHYASSETLRPGTGVTLSGEPGSSTIDFAVPAADGFLLCATVEADDVTIDGLVLRRAGDFQSVILSTETFQRFTLSRSVLVGSMDLYPGSICHGMKLSDSATSNGLHLRDSAITTTSYGLFQTNQSTAVHTDILVERCTFSGNRQSDLEFNSPNATTRQVRVQDCAFSDNDSPGFGVGLAKVEDAVVRWNTFDRYAMEAVHVEDYSSRIVVQANQFTACGLRKYSHVQLIGGSNGLQVIGNTFRANMNETEIYAVTAQPGGVGLTASGRQIIPPFDVAVQNNVFECSEAVTPIYFEGQRGGSITGNSITGPGIAGPSDAFHLLDSDGTTVRDNEINGLAY